MEILYPGEVERAARSFYVAGRAIVIEPDGVSRSANSGKLVVGFHTFGRRNFFVHHPGEPSHRQPSFNFRLLTSALLADMIWSDMSFNFAISCEHLGVVTYLSGAAARDADDREQGITSLHASGQIGSHGLQLDLKGDLARPFFLARAYEASFEIPWTILRFMFYDQLGFMNLYNTVQRNDT